MSRLDNEYPRGAETPRTRGDEVCAVPATAGASDARTGPTVKAAGAASPGGGEHPSPSSGRGSGRVEEILSGELGEPVPGSDFWIVVHALRAERAAHDVTAKAAATVAADLNRQLDEAHLSAARLVFERDEARALLGGGAMPGFTRDANGTYVREVRRRPAPESVASVLAAFDAVTHNGIGTGAHVLDALRTAAIREGLPAAASLPMPALVEACRAHVRSPASDGFGLGSTPALGSAA